MPRAVLSLPLTLIIALVVTAGVAAAPQAELWEEWTDHDPTSTRRVDHSRWDRFLTAYLITDDPSGIHLLPYGEVSEEDRRRLDRYLEDLQAVDVSRLNRAEQRAFWLNLYNAATVKVILDHYPVDSIRDIDISGTFSNGPWGAELLIVEGVPLTLDDIEHRILRPIYRDPRIHYAVNCASIGCPNLQPEAFTAENYEGLADRGARQFVNHPRGVAPNERPIVLSSIYNWFSEDFGDSREDLLAHLQDYADPALAAELADYEGRFTYDYDWSLNEP